MTPTHEMLRWRGVETPCPTCGGAGSRGYSGSATWRGGVGTNGGARDVCDVCWGSGDATRPWTDLRTLEATERQRVAEGAASLLARAAGANFSVMRPAVEEIAAELDRLARGRKPRPAFFVEACMGLARTLRAGLEAGR